MQAQALTERAQPDSRMWLSLGWESTWVARVGYAVALGGVTPSTADVAWTLPVFAGAPLHGGRLDFGWSPLVTAGRGVGAAAGLRSGLAWSADALGTRASWTAAVLVAPGYYDDSWHVAAEAGWRAALVTWMWHAAPVRDLYRDRGGVQGSAGPASGPFALSAQRVTAGLRGGWGRAQGVGVLMRAGIDLAPQAQGIVGAAPIYPLPFYVDLAGDYRW